MGDSIPEDVLAKFLAETEKKKTDKKEPSKAEPELPEDVTVLDPKAAEKLRRGRAREKLNQLMNGPKTRRTKCGNAMAERMRVPAPSTTFANRT